MPSIQSVMKRLGFVKLRDYGLVLTPEGRILSIRPAVLDDGVGGRIVGWKDDDLAAMELERWSELGRAMAAQPASRPAVARPVAVRPIAPIPPPPPVSPPPVSPRSVSPPKPIAPGLPPIAVAPVAPSPTPQKPLVVAPEPVVEEDDWEWTIAIARARAAAEEAEQAVVAARRPPAPVASPAAKAPTPSKPATSTDPIRRDSWEATQPLNDFDVSDYTSPTNKVLGVVKIAAAAKSPPPLGVPTPPQPLPVVKPAPVPTPPNRSFSRGLSPVTVIPIPKIPKVEPSRIAPVVVRRTGPAPIVPLAPRLAKGTTSPPIASSIASNANQVGDETKPNLVGEETLPSLFLSR